MKVDTQYQKTMQANTNHNREDELKKSAGEILNGVKRTVEVQVVNPNTFNFQDQTILGMFISGSILDTFLNNNVFSYFYLFLYVHYVQIFPTT